MALRGVVRMHTHLFCEEKDRERLLIGIKREPAPWGIREAIAWVEWIGDMGELSADFEGLSRSFLVNGLFKRGCRKMHGGGKVL